MAGTILNRIAHYNDMQVQTYLHIIYYIYGYLQYTQTQEVSREMICPADLRKQWVPENANFFYKGEQ